MRAFGLNLGLLLLLTAPVGARVETFYLGTYTDDAGSQGIYAGTLDSASGKLGALKLAAAVRNDPTFLAISPAGKFLFAALSDAVVSFKVQPDGTLVEINRRPAGPNTCHVSLDQTGRELFASSYDEGSVAAYPVAPDGRIGLRTGFVALHGSGPNPDRQTGPHAHSVCIDPENRFLYACDLGSDRIWIFRVGRKGDLVSTESSSAVAPPGSGPRHLVFQGRFVYVVNELSASTSVFARDLSTGALTLLKTETNIDPGWPKGTGSAEIAIHPSGKWLYVSTRLTDRMTVFDLNPDSAAIPALHRDQVVPCPVKFPRSFAIDPSGHWLVVAGETDNSISVLQIDPATGRLTPTNERAHASRPVCVLFDSSLH